MLRLSKTSSQSAAEAFAVPAVLIALLGCAPEAASPTMSPNQTKKDSDETRSTSEDIVPSPPAVQPQTANYGKPVKLPATHTVMPGETMYSLSVKYYGTGREVGRIIEANTERNIDVNSMQIGQELTIPALNEQ